MAIISPRRFSLHSPSPPRELVASDVIKIGKHDLLGLCLISYPGSTVDPKYAKKLSETVCKIDIASTTPTTLYQWHYLSYAALGCVRSVLPLRGVDLCRRSIPRRFYSLSLDAIFQNLWGELGVGAFASRGSTPPGCWGHQRPNRSFFCLFAASLRKVAPSFHVLFVSVTRSWRVNSTLHGTRSKGTHQTHTHTYTHTNALDRIERHTHIHTNKQTEGPGKRDALSCGGTSTIVLFDWGGRLRFVCLE